MVDWSFTTTALADVKLDRTPLPGEPDGKPYGGYCGLSWRGAKDFKDVTFLDSEGRKDMDIHRQHARWVDARGTLAGKPAGIAILDHPDNPGHPMSWFIVAQPDLPFWYINPAIVQPKPIELKNGPVAHPPLPDPRPRRFARSRRHEMVGRGRQRPSPALLPETAEDHLTARQTGHGRRRSHLPRQLREHHQSAARLQRADHPHVAGLADLPDRVVDDDHRAIGQVAHRLVHPPCRCGPEPAGSAPRPPPPAAARRPARAG